METKNNIWSLVHFKNAKLHVAPKQLLDDLKVDMTKRDLPTSDLYPDEDISKCMMDCPGMIMIDRGYQEFKIDTLLLSIPNTDVGLFFEEIKNSPVRMFESGKSYYKLHAWRLCLVLTPEQKELVQRQMEDIIDTANKAAEFENEEFDRRIAQINKSSPLVVVHPRSKISKSDREKLN